MTEIFSELKNIARENFAKYGTILEHKERQGGYEPLVKVESRGWIWAIMTIGNKTISEIECHPTSKESFEPVFGTTIIVLAPPDEPDKAEAFLLDTSVMLDEGVWHNILALSAVSRVKITENNDVTSKKHDLGREVGVAAIVRSA